MFSEKKQTKNPVGNWENRTGIKVEQIKGNARKIPQRVILSQFQRESLVCDTWSQGECLYHLYRVVIKIGRVGAGMWS